MRAAARTAALPGRRLMALPSPGSHASDRLSVDDPSRTNVRSPAPTSPASRVRRLDDPRLADDSLLAPRQPADRGDAARRARDGSSRRAPRLRLRHPRGAALCDCSAGSAPPGPVDRRARRGGHHDLESLRRAGDLLDRWIAPLFDDAPEVARIRLAACLIADVAGAAIPNSAPSAAIETALHGNWVAIDAPGRVMIAQALFSSFGGGAAFVDELAGLCSRTQLQCAISWGLAIRLGQRLSGGVAAPLRASALQRGERCAGA